MAKIYSDIQIVNALRAFEAGGKPSEVCKTMDIDKSVFYSWVRMYAGMNIVQVRQYRDLQKLKGPLKRMNLGATQELDILSKIIEKRKISPVVATSLLRKIA
jgi:hypothetical protein